MKGRTTLIRGARQLLTLRGRDGRPRRGDALGELGIITDGAVLIQDGVLAQVGASRRLENLAGARDALEISAAGRVVMPGFVDSHTHLVFPPSGGAAASDADAVRKLRAGTGQRLEGRVRACLESMARHGTTTVEAKTGSGPDLSGELKLLRVLAEFAQNPVETLPSVLARLAADAPGGPLAVAGWTIGELLPLVRRRRLAQFVDVEWSEDRALHSILAQCLQEARGMGLRCKIHADGTGASAIAAAVDHLVLSVDHLEGAGPGDLKPLGGAPVVATLLPGASWLGGGPFAPARQLIEQGAAVALASNFNPHHTPMPSIQAVIALARLHMGMTAEEAITAATVNGAHALGAAGRLGSLEPGKSADLIMLDTNDYRDLAHQFGANLVQFTMKRGNIIYSQGEVGSRTGAGGERVASRIGAAYERRQAQGKRDERNTETHGDRDRQHLRDGDRFGWLRRGDA